MSGGVRRDVQRGTWMFVLDVPSADGRRKQMLRRGFRTKKLAEDELNKLRDNINRGVHVDPNAVTVGEPLSDIWLPALTSAVRPSTRDTYERLVRTHIVPAFGGVKLQKLERVQVRRWVDELRSKMSAKSVRNVHAILNKALNDAVDLNLVARNFAAKMTLPRVERGAPRAWSADQLSRFLDTVADDRLYPLWRLFATTGCRRGEVRGVRWDDVNLNSGTATITHQRTIAGGRVVEGSPKTRACARTVALDAGTVTAQGVAGRAGHGTPPDGRKLAR